jgi:hypothetical protein
MNPTVSNAEPFLRSSLSHLGRGRAWKRR